MKRKNIGIGIFLILAAVLLVFRKLEIGPQISLFSIFLSLCWCWILIGGIRQRSFFKIVFALSFLYMIYDEPLGIAHEALTPWTILGAAFLCSMGLSMIFSRNKNRKWENSFRTDRAVYGSGNMQYEGENICCENNFGETNRYINSNNFCTASLENNFGQMNVYFDNAVIRGASASIDLETNFGEMKLFIPKEWRVEKSISRAFGVMQESGKPYEGDRTAVCYIRGSVNFGALIIYYI